MPSSVNEVVGKIMQIEDDLDLFNHTIDGVYFWERIRSGVLNKILKESGLIGQAHTTITPTFVTRVRNVFNALKNLFYKNPFLAPRSDIFIFGSARRKLGKDQKWYDIYCDPIIEKLNYSYVHVEKTYLGKHLSPAATPNCYYLDIVALLAALLRKLKLVRLKLNDKEIELVKKISQRIRKDCELDLNLFELIKGNLLSRKSQLPIYKLLFKKVQPKLIIMICSYGNETIVDAGKTIGVPVVELQHGFITSNHFGYSFPGPKRSKRSFPDYLLTFGDLWNTIADFPIAADKVISIGYPYMEKEIKEYSSVKQKDQIVFISQGTVGKELSKIAVDLSHKIDPFYKVVYKLHPGEYSRWRTEYPWLINSKVTVVDDDTYPLYKIFAESKVQIGVSSTAILEGLVFGLKTILLPLGKGVESMHPLIDNKMVVIADNAEKVMQEIERVGVKIDLDISSIFKENAIDNINNVISELINA